MLSVVAIYGLGGVVVADARVDRNAVQHVAIRLEEREEPVVVLDARGANRHAEDPMARVDVVAGRHDGADVVLLEGKLHRLRDLVLTARRGRAEDAGAVVADDHEGEGAGRFCGRVRVRAEPVVVTPSALPESLLPVTAFPS